MITGVSGSGKSSLAFDTIYAEGQRRYVESLSAYARQFLGQMEKPEVDYIEGLSPAISIDQKGVSKNPRSTVGTVTEIYDYLRLLYARAGRPHCPRCGGLLIARRSRRWSMRSLASRRAAPHDPRAGHSRPGRASTCRCSRMHDEQAMCAPALTPAFAISTRTSSSTRISVIASRSSSTV